MKALVGLLAGFAVLMTYLVGQLIMQERRDKNAIFILCDIAEQNTHKHLAVCEGYP